MKQKDFSFFSLGGIGEIGLNCYILTISGESFIIDMGLDFPDNVNSSIGVMLPDISFIKEHLPLFKGIIFTHGHDDHIGAFPHYSELFNIPVYASPFAAELIKHKLKEMDKPPLQKLILITENNKTVNIGSHTFHFFETKHSIPHSYGFYVKTPYGNVIFTSDFKDIHNISSLPKEPFILFSDSTNAESDVDIEECDVDKTIADIFASAKGAIIATTFSSHIERIGKMINLAKEHGKELFVVGKNIENTVTIAKKLGLIDIPPVNHWDRIDRFPREKIFIITTGSQGEKFSSLSLISKGTYRGFDIMKGDTIIVSSSIIPGNEVNIYNMINRFSEKEVDVYYAKTAKVHTSGHGSQHILKKIIKNLKPRVIVPIHGEARHLNALKKMALKLGYAENHVITLKNGMFLEVENSVLKIKEGIELEKKFLDDDGGYALDKNVIKERRKLSENGIIFALINIKDGFSVKIDTFGLLSDENKLSFEKTLKEEIKERIIPAYYAAEGDFSALKEAVTQVIKTFTKRKLTKKPVVKIEIVEGRCY